MHLEILSSEQTELLPFIQTFKSKFFLVGGTAIALQVGHRKSIDFDLFTTKPFSTTSIHKKVISTYPNAKILFKSDDQIHYIINHVKITFFYYPYAITPVVPLDKFIKMPDLLSLAAMKSFALGRRAKWKDYVDLYFLLKDFYSLEEITLKSKEIFKGDFSPKLIKQQMTYFDDIDYHEEVFYLSGFEVQNQIVKDFLIEIATRRL